MDSNLNNAIERLDREADDSVRLQVRWEMMPSHECSINLVMHL
jgi:hypothetical protein